MLGSLHMLLIFPIIQIYIDGVHLSYDFRVAMERVARQGTIVGGDYGGHIVERRASSRRILETESASGKIHEITGFSAECRFWMDYFNNVLK